MATDTAGAVYLLAYQNVDTGGPLTSAGVFLARLNANLTVQWLRPVNGSSFMMRRLAVDQQGNAFVFFPGPYIDSVGYRLQLTSYNPSGAVRAGFPVIVGTGIAVAEPGGLAIDAIGQVHVLGLTAAVNQYVYTVSYGVYGNSGEVVRAPGNIN